MRTLLAIDAAGPLTTIQDAGRFGHLRHGVTRSGPIDRRAFAAVQAALGNPPGGAMVEVSHGGLALRCVEGAVVFALAGGDFTAQIDGVSLGGWTTGVLRPGSRLVVRDGAAGNWGCLGFAGVIDCPRWLGSAATLALAGLGGGRLAGGDTLVVEADPVGDAAPRPLPRPPAADGPIRIVIGPQAEWFAAEAVAALLAETFQVAPAFDRMGMVLDGPALLPLSVTMLSAPLLRGAMQVNGAGTPTILLADHQTTAGYPRIATVISADLDRVAQLRPGTPLRFAAVTVDVAIAAARAVAAQDAGWLQQVSAGRLEGELGSLADRLAGANLIDGVVDAMGGNLP